MNKICKNCKAKINPEENNWEKHCSDCQQEFCFHCVDNHTCEENSKDTGILADHLEEVDRD